MSKRRALSGKHRPRGLNLSWYALLWLLMDRLDPAAWVWGSVGAIAALFFVVNAVDFFTAEDIEL